MGENWTCEQHEETRNVQFDRRHRPKINAERMESGSLGMCNVNYDCRLLSDRRWYRRYRMSVPRSLNPLDISDDIAPAEHRIGPDGEELREFYA